MSIARCTVAYRKQIDYEAAAASAPTASISAGVLALVCSACRPEASEGGVDQSLALGCRLGCLFSEVVEKRGDEAKRATKEKRN